MTAKERRRRFMRAEPLLGGAALVLLLIGCFFVIRPFLTALLWAVILAYSLHPLQRVFTRLFRGSRTLAACLVTLTLAVGFAGPIVLVGLGLAQDGKDLAAATRKWFLAAPERPPAWVGAAPVVGDEIDAIWQSVAADRKRWVEQIDRKVTAPPRAQVVADPAAGPAVADGAAGDDGGNGGRDEPSQVVELLARFLVWARDWLLGAGLAVGQGVTQVLVSAFLAFFLLRDGPELAKRLGVAVERLAGERGQHLIKVAGDTVDGVIYGILGTALIQALVAGVGFWIAGIPGAALLAVLTFFFAVIPFGPLFIWLPAALWLFGHDQVGMGIFMLIWGFFGISGVDNIVRPYLISQGSKMPFVLIFFGVIGGAISFGLVGVFLGPTLLAVGFRLIEEWSSLQEVDAAIEAAAGDPLISGLPAAGDSDKPPPHGGKSLGIG